MRQLTGPLFAYRFGDPTDIYPIYSARGARVNRGRWNDVGEEVIYASEHYATAMLEQLVRLDGAIPAGQFFVEITIPPGIKYEVVDTKKLKGWDSPDSGVARRYGHRWYEEKRAAVLIVPSMVAHIERNIVINAKHPDFPRIKPGRKTRVRWDARLFPKHVP
ncbi:MAG: RES domain-containing protein [Gammaproteobacteria bacterium]|nr:RES domain-containing protein [Gammaproteobacteria bacterium]